MNVEILLSACNSPNKLGLSGKIIVGFQNCIEQSTLTDDEASIVLLQLSSSGLSKTTMGMQSEQRIGSV